MTAGPLGAAASSPDLRSTLLATPLGSMALACSDAGVTACHFLDDEAAPISVSRGCGLASLEAASAAQPLLGALARELGEYFSGQRQVFTIAVDTSRGTPFQRQVWQALLRIPHGETRSYSELAAELGRPSASRAVGGANGSNPMAIIIPCHRVISRGGGLGGYSAGLERKRWLLQHERQQHAIK